jgi:hypothetical protein
LPFDRERILLYDLDGNIPMEHLVVGTIDGAHSTFADPRHDAAMPKYLTYQVPS